MSCMYNLGVGSGVRGRCHIWEGRDYISNFMVLIRKRTYKKKTNAFTQ